MTQEESKVANKCIKYIKELQDSGCPIFYEHRSGSGGYNYKKGIPDFYLVNNGLHIEVEFKTEKGRLSTMQENFKHRCLNVYHIPYCNPHSFEEFKSFIDNYIKK